MAKSVIPHLKHRLWINLASQVEAFWSGFLRCLYSDVSGINDEKAPVASAFALRDCHPAASAVTSPAPVCESWSQLAG
jgi:hypothetical protein